MSYFTYLLSGIAERFWVIGKKKKSRLIFSGKSEYHHVRVSVCAHREILSWGRFMSVGVNYWA